MLPKDPALRFRLSLFALTFVTVLVYLPAIRGDYVWDDFPYVVENPTIRQPDGLRKIWFEPESTNNYYPAVFTSYWLEYRLWGRHPSGYHLTNVLLHAANSILLVLILRRLSVPGALLAGWVFALHPVHVESVAWIAERKDTLSGFFFLSGLLYGVRYLKDRKIGDYAAMSLLYLGALFSKTVTCTWPAVILLLAWYLHRGTWKRFIVPVIPHFVAGLGFGLITAIWGANRTGAIRPDFGLSLVDRILIAGKTVWFYLWKLVWPLELSPIYPRWEIDPSVAVQYVGPLALLATSLSVWVLREKLSGTLFLTWFYFVGVLSPAMGFITYSTMNLSFVADHYQYLASAGPIAFVCGFAAHQVRAKLAIRFRSLAVTAGVALFLGMAFLSWRHAEVFSTSEKLWTRAMAVNPGSWAVHNNLAAAMLAKENTIEAREYADEALRLRPGHAGVLHILAAIEEREGDVEKGKDILLDALEKDPGHPTTLHRLGRVHARLGEHETAVENYRGALEKVPDDPKILNDLGLAEAALGRLEEAKRSFEKAIEIDPAFEAAKGNLRVVQSDLRWAEYRARQERDGKE